MQALFELLFGAVGAGRRSHYLAIFGALVIGGYVAGHLARKQHAFNGALASVLYIFVTVTFGRAARGAAGARVRAECAAADRPAAADDHRCAGDGRRGWGGWLAGRF